MSEHAWAAAIEKVARRWVDPEHPGRLAASARTLAAENRFTFEGLAFTLNHACDFISRGGLRRWLGEAVPVLDRSVGVLSRGRTPLEGLFEAAAAGLVAERVLIALSASSPALAAGFFEEVADEAGTSRVALVAEAELLRHADVVIARGTEQELAAWHRALDARELPGEQRLLLPVRLGVAVIDGTEDRRARSGLAEDLLLHEGGTPQSVRAVFAPAGLPPDPLLEALAGFREVFPPHAATAGTLALRAAFLEALGVSLALGPGFLVTRGDFEPQEGAHLRWVEYASLAEVAERLHACDPARLAVTASAKNRRALAEMGLAAPAMLDFGDAHRPRPGQPPLTAEVPELFRQLAQGRHARG